MEDSAARGPLSGVIVADLSTVLAGPYCTMVLGDLGADVIKVEPPEGDATRGWGPPWMNGGDGSRTAAYYFAVNRNKRSLRLDLRQPQGKEVLRRLLGRSHVVVENFRPGTFARLGFDEAALAAINPRLVHLAVTGYGPDGPDADKPGYDFVAQAVGGLMSVTGFADAEGGRPTKVGVAISDIATGLFGAIAILAALRDGTSRRVDVSLLESTLALLINQAQNAFVTGEQPARRGNAHPNIVPYEIFETADAPIAVAAASERQWPRLCHAVEMPELVADGRFADNAARVENRALLRMLLAERFSTAPSHEWLARLDAAEVPCGPVNDVLTAIEQPQAAARAMDARVQHPSLGSIRQVGVPIKMSGLERPLRLPPPLLGEHSRAILAEFGFSEREVEQLVDAGVV